MDEQKLTDWFPPEVLPVRPGWYQREYSAHSNRSARLNEIPDYFDGKHWYLGYGGGGHASIPVSNPTFMRWRGLAKPPLTDWFDPDTPPEREGVYELEAQDGEIRAFAHWSPGHGWGLTYYAVRCGDNWAIRAARQGRGGRGLIAPCRRWRGLAVQP